MNRRGFLAGILALGAAPAIVKAENIMRVSTKIIVPGRWERQDVIGSFLLLDENGLPADASKEMGVISEATVDTYDVFGETFFPTITIKDEDLSKSLGKHYYKGGADALAGGVSEEPNMLFYDGQLFERINNKWLPVTD